MSLSQSSPVYDAIAFGSEDDGIRRIGVFLAWAANHRMLSDLVEHSAGRVVARVRIRDLRGSELLGTVCHGELTTEHLNAAGNEFARRYYTQDAQVGYRAAYARAIDEERSLGLSRDSLTSADGEWALYDRLAPEIMRAQRGPAQSAQPQILPARKNKVASFLRLVK